MGIINFKPLPSLSVFDFPSELKVKGLTIPNF